MSSPHSQSINWNTKLSSSATSLNNVVRLEDYRSSHSIRGDWQSRKIEELIALAGECAMDNSEFDEVSALRAREFIESLPFDIELPAIGIEDSGRVLLEWFVKLRSKEPTIFSISFGRDNYIFSLTVPDNPPFHGALNYSGDSMDFLISKIRFHFGISLDHARLNAR